MTKRKDKTQRRFRGTIMPTSSHPDIRKVKRKGNYPSIHGNKLWKSSCLVIDYLKKNPPDHADTVIDVGCGWGASGIWCAKHLGSKVTSMDADPDVFPFLNVAATLNKVETKPLVTRFEKLKKRQLAHYDLLIAADICFWDELVDPVFRMVDRAVKAGVKQIVIADPERPTFHEMAAKSVKKHGAELVEWETRSPIKARGALLVIHNA
ncbi:MAG: class I SAM-dependent methyltransferase [Pseudomonadota bacterium]